MGAWVLLFTLGLIAGWATAFALASPRWVALAWFTAGTASLGAALATAASLMRLYGSPAATATAVLFVVSATAAGYGVACATLPLLTPRQARRPLGPSTASGAGLIIIGWTEPQDYDLRAEIATHQALIETGALDLPSILMPLQLLARKSRYRAAGGHSPGARHLTRLADALATQTEPWGTQGVLGVCAMQPQALADAVRELAGAGCESIGVVVLGTSDAEEIDEQKRRLAPLGLRNAGVDIRFATPVLCDDRIARRLADRIISLTQDVPPASVGVVLVSAGSPEPWRHSHRAGSEEQNYFDQRVRMLLSEAGLDDRVIRQAWLDWQTPDVAEAARHVAALGCERIVVAPSTILLPTLYTAVDLERIVAMLRLPDGVEAITLSSPEPDESLVETVRDHAREALRIT